MLVFVIPSSYPNHINTQANIFVHEQCMALKKAECNVVAFDVTSFRWNYWLDKSCWKATKRSKDGIPVYEKHIPALLKNNLFRLAVVQFYINIEKLFKKAIKEYGMPDVLYAHFTYPAGYVATKLAKKYNIPLFTIEHGGIFMKEKVPSYLKKILRKTIENSDGFACVSEAQRKALYLCTDTNKEIKIITNMIADTYKYYPIPQRDNFVFFSAGNLYKVKRMDLLIEGFIKAFTKDEKVCLRIAGAGGERGKLEKIIADNNREGQIVLLGRLDREEMLKEYINCNCFTLFSEHESFGIAYREAMAVGRPVISSDNGGISTFWEDDFGKIVPINDVQKLSKAMKDLKNNFTDYNLKKISENTLLNCSSENVIKKIKEIFFNI